MNSRRWVLTLGALLLLGGVGCSYPTDDYRLVVDASMERRDTSRPDTAPPDMAPPDMAPPEDMVAPPDTAPPEDMVAPPDTAPPDTAPPDGGCTTNADCAGGRSCCQGLCVDTQTSVPHCGRCGAVCDPPNGDPACVAGACTVPRCDMGFGNCDGNAANGCETDLSSDPMHCGACNMRCSAPLNASASCSAGRCTFTCNPGFADCNNNPADGCEENLRSSLRACGTCGNTCTGPMGTTPLCSAGVCSTRCVAGTADCDGDTSNGCEVDVQSNASHCGGCGVVCSFPNARATCSAGTCLRSSCSPGFGDCDGNMANGCETDVQNSTTHCGGCGRSCPAGQVCRMGACLATCAPAPLMMCGTTCVDTSVQVAHCGGCGRMCAFANATAECRGGTCALAACLPGFANCDGNPSNGCEVNLNTDANHCGGCNLPCNRSNGTASCAAGVCRITCNAGFANCDNDPSDGCETAIGTDVRNCGACGRACALPNATALCSAGTCAVSACLRGYGNCDGNAANGCEASLLDDESNCGSCGTPCSRGQFCVNGTCSSCAPPQVLCSGRCVDTSTNPSHCGACGRLCLSGQQCVQGRCVYPPPSNDRCSGAAEINLAAGSRITLAATTLGATHDINSPCDTAGGGDVFFRFVLTRREFVYADTFGANWDTKLFFVTASCTTPLTSQVTGDLVCDDNLGAFCTTGGSASQVYTVLNPGTYYLVLSSGTSSGSTTLRFEHIPVGAGTPIQLPQGSSLVRLGATSGTTGGISQSCGGAGPEAIYWWVTCPEQPAGTFTASTCGRATWNTVLSVINGSGMGNVCNNDACGLQSSVTTTIPAGSGIHVLMLDGFNNGTDPVSGPYGLLYTRP